ncbi:MAG TPA: PrgI family protein [Candidatus Moranbacteria bacterium]|nr:PrgI family protein [Candidatus Moranbacteria bacterium]
MLFNVPQFIDIEDKIVGPLTAKQLGWLAGGGVILLVLWNYLDTEAFLIAAVVVSIIFGALAFYRPYNQSLVSFIFSSFSFAFRPKIYVWKRLPEKIRPIVKAPKEMIGPKEKKKIDSQKLSELSKMLDLNKK